MSTYQELGLELYFGRWGAGHNAAHKTYLKGNKEGRGTGMSPRGKFSGLPEIWRGE